MDTSKRSSAAMDVQGLDYDEPIEQPAKRPRTDRNSKTKHSNQPRVDPTYGQRSAFPGLDSYSAYTEEDDDLEYGDDIEALQYLQSVRNEAAGIPTLLVAPKSDRDDEEGPDRSIYEDGVGDGRGFYSEGAYVGASLSNPQSGAGSGVPRDAQAVYFESLLQRFKRLHTLLATKPPQLVIDGLSSNHPSFMSGSRDDLRGWRWRLFNTDPQPAQLAIMDKGTVFKLLRLILTNNGALGGKTLISNRLSSWIWGLLAKVPISGELTSEEVGLIRELGKRAVWLGVEMRGVDIRELYRETNDEEEEEEIIVDFDIDCGTEAEEDVARPIIGPVMPSTEDILPMIGNLMEAQAVPELNPSVDDTIAMTPSAPDDHAPAEQIALAAGTIGGNDSVEDEGNAEDEQARIAAMKERLLASLNSNEDASADTEEAAGTHHTAEVGIKEKDTTSDLENAKITVDMIITVAGEMYGQRDLLEFREEWD